VRSTHEVISAFLDDDTFDPQELTNALSDPAGRALLIDLMALRRIVQPRAAAPTLDLVKPARPVWPLLAAAAAVVVALASGYLVGQRRSVPLLSDAPPATKVVQAVPFVPAGGMR